MLRAQTAAASLRREYRDGNGTLAEATAGARRAFVAAIRTEAHLFELIAVTEGVCTCLCSMSLALICCALPAIDIFQSDGEPERLAAVPRCGQHHSDLQAMVLC